MKPSCFSIKTQRGVERSHGDAQMVNFEFVRSNAHDPGIDNRVWVRASRRYFLRGSLKINVRKLFDQPFAQHLAQAQSPMGDGAILRPGAAEKFAGGAERFTDPLALGGDWCG